MGRKSKTIKTDKNTSAGDASKISDQLSAIEKQNISVQKSISSFGARLNLIRHLLRKI